MSDILSRSTFTAASDESCVEEGRRSEVMVKLAELECERQN
jgi:hypothetical protein